jgi:DNA replication protein DnaC
VRWPSTPAAGGTPRSTSGCHDWLKNCAFAHGNGTFGKWLLQLAKTDVLLLDDWGMAGIDSQTRADLLEIIDDRAANKATIITSQLPIDHWHAWIGDATIADAMMDRLMQRHHRFTLAGDSLR